MLTIYDHALALAFVAGLPLRAWFAMRALRAVAPEQAVARRRSLYRKAMAFQWTLAALTLALWAIEHRPWQGLGLVVTLRPGLIGVLAGIVLVVPMVWRQGRRAGPEELARLRARFEHLESMLPHSERDLAWFRALSVTAGVCEELFFRGFLVWYLAHWTGVIQALGITSLAFGLGHAYQGAKGIVQTGLLGAFLGAVYFFSGSLLAPMIIHALMDLYAGELTFRAFGSGAGDRAGEAA